MPVTCPKCTHEFEPEMGIRVKPIAGLEELLSADAKGFYGTMDPQPTSAAGFQFLVAVAEATDLMNRIHDDAMEKAVEKQTKRMAHVYNRLVHEGLVKQGLFTPPCRVPLAQLSPKQRELLIMYPRTDLSQAELNEKLGGFYLFTQEGEVPPVEGWDAYAKANGLE